MWRKLKQLGRFISGRPTFADVMATPRDVERVELAILNLVWGLRHAG